MSTIDTKGYLFMKYPLCNSLDFFNVHKARFIIPYCYYTGLPSKSVQHQHQLIVTQYTLSIYPSVPNQLMRTLFEARPVCKVCIQGIMKRAVM